MAEEPNMVNRPNPKKLEQNKRTNIKQVIGIMSGKGGVGKSLVCGLLACDAQRRGLKVGILDADITGPSIPHMFGLDARRATMDGDLIAPAVAANGVKVMSVNLLVANPDDPVVWRGPVIAGAVSQFWTDVAWGDLDVLFVDMPPGTGDVPLTVFQSLPIDGVVIVTSPQDLVAMIVSKAVKMAKMMDVPVLGVVENMSYLACPDCGKHINLFGESHLDDVAKSFGLDVLARLPIDPSFAKLCDEGHADQIPDVGINAQNVLDTGATARVKSALGGVWSLSTDAPNEQ
ncbi:MAG: Mrp/NBP35 family ATP-binding protein [Coriobacteriia bacterium]|nr:Mrp/NBP35 family ATP-binding protein [Coriobacteriia bacterium]MBS5478585.1 Mrp/NBP35 family ATP-binding protein [Coriobacteriia bacterium]